MTEDARVEAPTIRLGGGGPSHKLLTRLRLLSLRVRLPVAVALTWVPLALLCALEGTLHGGSGETLSFLSDPAPHARFLVGLPLLLVVGIVIDPVLGIFGRYLFQSGILPEERHQHFDAAVARLRSARDNPWVDVVLVVLSYVVVYLVVVGGDDPRIGPGQRTWLAVNEDGVLRLSGAGWWYFLVGVPLIQFVFFRWTWRYLVWSVFLWRLSRLKLQFEPTHPDQVGGLGILQLPQTAFAGVGIAIGASLCGMLAHDILHEGSSLAGVRPTLIGFGVVNLLVLALPTLAFVHTLGQAKRKGLASYGVLGTRLARHFRERWTGASNQAENLIESTEASSAADFGSEFESIQKMRTLPLGVGGLLRILALLSIPFVPLLLTENSVRDVLQKLLRLLG